MSVTSWKQVSDLLQIAEVYAKSDVNESAQWTQLRAAVDTRSGAISSGDTDVSVPLLNPSYVLARLILVKYSHLDKRLRNV